VNNENELNNENEYVPVKIPDWNYQITIGIIKNFFNVGSWIYKYKKPHFNVGSWIYNIYHRNKEEGI
jgi:hypothetical protein